VRSGGDRCPGQDGRSIRPDDVVEVACKGCGETIEFWPDELLRRCRACGRRVSNPRFDLGCLQWCPAADKCLARLRGRADGPAVPPRLVDKAGGAGDE